MASTNKLASDHIDQEKVAVSYVEDNDASKRRYQEYRHNDEQKSFGHYLATRFTTLKPTITIPPNPFTLLGLLSRKQWMFFAVSASHSLWPSTAKTRENI